MTALSTTSIEAGMSMARRPSRLPVAVSSASPSSLRVPVTSTRSSNAAVGRLTSRRAGDPAATVTGVVRGANPSRMAVMLYVPGGTSSMVNAPSGPVVADSPSSSIVTTAAASGAPPASSATVPSTEPCACASAWAGAASCIAAAASIAAKVIFLRANPRLVLLCDGNLRSFVVVARLPAACFPAGTMGRVARRIN